MLTVNLLGPPEVWIDGRPIKVDTRKAIALLAYLVVEKSASRDTLAALLWADSSQERARATLRRTLSALRGAGDAHMIDADRALVSLVGPTATDFDTLAAELEATAGHDHEPNDVCSRCIPHLRRATALYRGDFLAGFSVRSSPEFEDWVRGVAESTRIRIGAAFHRLAIALAANGDYPGAISAVHKWIDLDPLHEPAHRHFMLLHAWAGDRPGAMEAYRNCVAILDQELGVPPLEETTELYEAILDEDLPPAPGAPRRIRAEANSTRHGESDLIDREAEMSVLRNTLSELSTDGAVIALTGVAWVGKTRLLEEFGVAASSTGQTAIIGRAFRMEQSLPYGVATQLLRALDPLIGANRELIPPWAMAEMARLMPESSESPPPGDTADPFGELRLLEGVFTALTVVTSRSPLILVIDDAQWLDQASAGLVSYLARRIEGVPILLVVAARSGEPLSEMVQDLMSGASIQIDLQPLSVDQLIGVAGTAEAAAELHTRTGGVPLLVTEELAGNADGEAPGMIRYMESRLRDVGDLGRQVLAAAAILNGVCDAALLKETSGRTDEEVVDAVEELVAAGLLREVPDSEGLTFTLDALERIAYDSTSLIRRRLLHKRAATALTDRPRSGSDPRLAAAVAAQHEGAGSQEAPDWYLQAAELARRVFAHAEARSLFEKALGLGHPDVAAIRLALGEVAMIEGDYDTALRELTAAAARADGSLLGLAEHRLGEVQRLVGRFELAEEHFARSLEDHPEPAAVLSDWALLAHRTGDTKQAIRLADRARTAAEHEDDARQLSRVHNILTVVTLGRNDALGHVEEAIRLAGDDQLLRMAALNNRAVLVSETGDNDEAVDLIQEAITIAERTGHRHREAALWNHLADLHHRAGREHEAQESLTKAVSLFADIDAGEMEPELWLLERW